MIHTYTVADSMAVYFRRLTTFALIGVLGLTFLALVVYQFVDKIDWHSHHPPGVPGILVGGYVLALVAAYLIYIWAHHVKSLQKRHLDYRALAEGFRVQIFWYLAGIWASAADFYLRKQRGELEWIRHAIRAGAMLVAQPDGGLSVSAQDRAGRAQAVLACWVKDQHEWYTKSSRKNEAGAKSIKRLGRFIAIPVALLLASGKLLKATIWEGHPAIVQRFFSKPYEDWSHLWAFGITFLVVAAIGLLQVYSKFSALSEQGKQYSRMAIAFGNALRYIEGLESLDSPEARSVLSELGREALLENGDWLLLHRERPLEVPKA
jgi:hypothetical protein